jgi:hypothetical protein
MATSARLARRTKARPAAVKAPRAKVVTDSERLDFVERTQLQVKRSQETGLWVASHWHSSRVDSFPSLTLRGAINLAMRGPGKK